MAMRHRLTRSELAVPGSSPKMLGKAPHAGADTVVMDLEDAVAPEDKAQARANVITALHEQDWSRCSVAVRVNGLDTEYFYRDLIDVVEQAGDKLDIIVLPKANSAADMHLLATLLDQIETAKGIEEPIGIYALVETALGLTNVEDIARNAPARLEAMVFGVADYAASIQSSISSIGGVSPDYSVLTDAEEPDERVTHWGDPWHYALARLAVACRAYGLRPIDGPYGDFRDPTGLLASARRSAVLGYEGKWVIHPAQVEHANEVYTPDEKTREHTRRVVSAMEEAAAAGAGAVSLDGRMIDMASIRQAEALLVKIEQIEKRGGVPEPASGA